MVAMIKQRISGCEQRAVAKIEREGGQLECRLASLLRGRAYVGAGTGCGQRIHSLPNSTMLSRLTRTAGFFASDASRSPLPGIGESLLKSAMPRANSIPSG